MNAEVSNPFVPLFCHFGRIFLAAGPIYGFTASVLSLPMAADDHQAQLRAAVLFRLDAHHGVVHDVDGDSQERRLEDDSGASGLSKEWSKGKLARERGLSWSSRVFKQGSWIQRRAF